MFVKRVIKGKFRSNLDADIVDQVEDDDDQQESSNAMIDMKLEQNLRKRRLGTEFSSDAGVVVKPGKVYKSSVQKSIESTLGSQFESRIDDGSGSSAFNHEKIMEQYINQKMGIAEPRYSSRSPQDSFYNQRITARNSHDTSTLHQFCASYKANKQR